MSKLDGGFANRRGQLARFGLSALVVAWTVTIGAASEPPPANVYRVTSPADLIDDRQNGSRGDLPGNLSGLPDVTHPDDESPLDNSIQWISPDEVYRLAQDENPLPLRLNPLTRPTPLPASIQPLMPELIAAESASRRLLSPTRELNTRSPGRSLVFGTQSANGVTTDAGSLLGRSAAARQSRIQRRSPIINDPRVRGSGTGSLLASGSYWIPARQDLDTMLSKIDSHLVASMIVIPGPYSARYGPGLNFIDMELVQSPRYEDGYQAHGSSLLEYQTNGQQFYGRQTVLLGDDEWGIRAGYGHRGGSDYQTGNGNQIPGSYQSRDVDLAMGWDLSPDSQLEFSYLRLDQTDVEIPGAVFDLNYLITDAYEVKYVLENQAYFDRLTADAWFNRTQFKGNAERSGKRNQITDLILLDFHGETEVNSMSTGFSVATTWGQPEDQQLTTGVDMRYIRQALKEVSNLTISNMTFTGQSAPVPGSFSSNPGLFTEVLLPVQDYFTVKAGSRVDWVSTDVVGEFTGHDSLAANPSDKDALLTRELYLQNFGIKSTGRNFLLFAGYLTTEYAIDENLTLSLGAGTAQRPPTLTELYAYGTFLSVLQQGLTSVIGQPGLKAPRSWQVDSGLQADYDQARVGISGFGSLVEEFITYEALNEQALGSVDALAVRFTNTPLASLIGGEAHAEYDHSSNVTAYGGVSYVDGRDLTRTAGGLTFPFPPYPSDPTGVRGGALGGKIFSKHEPLPGISPLESRLGYRIHDSAPLRRWAIDLFTRVVTRQHRVASSLHEQFTPGFTTLNISSYWKPSDQWKLVAGVDNITNTYYREHLDLRSGLGVFQPGVSFYFGSEVNY